jgi:FdrA protein
VIASEVRRGRWADSAKLLAAARAAEATDGVEQALCFMATPANVAEARQMGIAAESIDGAGPDDLVIAVRGPAAADGVRAAAAVLDAQPGGGEAAATQAAPRNIAKVDADVALISVPGEYAALEAHKALSAGMDVMLFSDGVTLEDEVALKRRARELGRLVMGPGCGTAILDGVGLGFANVVRRGPVGVVAAAGTGAQEVTVLLDGFGAGVSGCYGTGGRDLHEEVGAITMLDAIERLASHPETEVLLCVSKPPAPSVAEQVLAALAATSKPAAVCFVGAAGLDAPDGVILATTLEDAAVAAARLAGADAQSFPQPTVDWVHPGLVRGLFSGGTLCSEAAAILAERLPRVESNAAAGRAVKLDPGEPPTTHACIDLGEEEYTRGRPHPMIDPVARAEMLADVAAGSDVAVILIDVVLGYGSHPDPAGALLPAIGDALARSDGLAVVAHVCGTESDPQVRSRQESALAEAGVRLAPTNANAARLAAALVG